MLEFYLTIPLLILICFVIFYYIIYGKEIYTLDDNFETIQKELDDIHNTQLDSILNSKPGSVIYCDNPNALVNAFKDYSYKSKVGRTRKCVASGCSIQVPMELTYCDSCYTKFAKKDIWEVKDETFLPAITAISGIKLNKKENLTKCSKLLWE